MPANVSGVLAGLTGTADDHVFNTTGPEGGTRHQPPNGLGKQVIRAHGRKRPGVAAEGRSNSIVNESILHVGVVPSLAWNQPAVGLGTARRSPPCTNAGNPEKKTKTGTGYSRNIRLSKTTHASESGNFHAPHSKICVTTLSDRRISPSLASQSLAYRAKYLLIIWPD
jgi:hypothetical protein